jgi:polysaccharide chain length determinant protein (PEP-CTERM system associated)
MIRQELTFTDYVTIMRRRWVPIVLLTLIGGPLAYGVSRFLPPRYTSETTVLIQQPTVPSDMVRPVVTQDLSGRLTSMEEQVLSRARLEPIIRQLGLSTGESSSVPMGEWVAILQKGIEISAIKPIAETGGPLPGFTVSVTLDNPRTAQAVCNAITSMFIQADAQLRQENSEDTSQFLDQQLADAKKTLDEQDAKLAAFQSRYLGSLPDDSSTDLDILNGLTSQLNSVTEALSRAQQDKSFIETSLNQATEAWQASQNGTSAQTLAQQLADAQTRLIDLRAQYTDDYPDVIRAKSDIAVLKKEIAAQRRAPKDTSNSSEDLGPTLEPDNIQQLRAELHNINVQITQNTTEQGQLKKQIKVYEARMQSTPDVQKQYTELTRGTKVALDNYNDLQRNRDAARMATDLERRQEGETFSILDPASLPNQPSFPKRPLFAAAGFAGGLALGVGLAFLLEARDRSIRTEQDVEFALRLPVIVMVPAVGPIATRKTAKFLPSFGNGSGIDDTLNS